MIKTVLSVGGITAAFPLYAGFTQGYAGACIALRTCDPSYEYKELWMLFEARRNFILGFNRALPVGIAVGGTYALARFGRPRITAYLRKDSNKEKI